MKKFHLILGLVFLIMAGAAVAESNNLPKPKKGKHKSAKKTKKKKSGYYFNFQH